MVQFTGAFKSAATGNASSPTQTQFAAATTTVNTANQFLFPLVFSNTRVKAVKKSDGSLLSDVDVLVLQEPFRNAIEIQNGTGTGKLLKITYSNIIGINTENGKIYSTSDIIVGGLSNRQTLKFEKKTIGADITQIRGDRDDAVIG